MATADSSIYDNLKQKIEALKLEIIPYSINPERMGTLLDELLAVIKGNGTAINNLQAALSDETNEREKKDTELEGLITQLRKEFDTLVGGNPSKAIENFNEIIKFLEGIEDSETLVGKLAELKLECDDNRKELEEKLKTEAQTRQLADKALGERIDSEAQAREDADDEIRGEVNKLRGDFDTLVSGDTSTAIDNFNEVIQFLEGIEDSETLIAKLTLLKQECDTNKAELEVKLEAEKEAREGMIEQSVSDSADKVPSSKAVKDHVDKNGGQKILGWTTDAATTRKLVDAGSRKSGLTISYEHPEQGWINEQYIGTVFTDAEWVKDANWQKLATAGDMTEGIKGAITSEITDDEDKAPSNKAVFEALNKEYGIEIKDLLSISGKYINTDGNIGSASTFSILYMKIKKGERFLLHYDKAIDTFARAYAIYSTDSTDMFGKGTMLVIGPVPDKDNADYVIDITQDNASTLVILSYTTSIPVLSRLKYRNNFQYLEEEIKETQENIGSLNKSFDREFFSDDYIALQQTGILEKKYIDAYGNILSNDNFSVLYFSAKTGDRFKLHYNSFPETSASAWCTYSVDSPDSFSSSTKCRIGSKPQSGGDMEIEVTDPDVKAIAIQAHVTSTPVLSKLSQVRLKDKIVRNMLVAKQWEIKGNVRYDANELPVSYDITWADGSPGTVLLSDFDDEVLEYKTIKATYGSRSVTFHKTFDSNGYEIKEEYIIN